MALALLSGVALAASRGDAVLNGPSRERAAFVFATKLDPRTLGPAVQESDFSSVALDGQRTGGSSQGVEPGSGYVVRRGDTLTSIGASAGITVAELSAANSSVVDSARSLQVGTVLSVPLPLPKPTASKASAVRRRQSVSAGFGLPIAAYRYVSQGFSAFHPGIDFAADQGSTVIASKAGCVAIAQAGYNGGYGTTVVLDNGDGWSTRYAHLSRLDPGLLPGVCVEAGAELGASGNTGRSTGPHLHFEIRKDGTAVNPGM